MSRSRRLTRDQWITLVLAALAGAAGSLPADSPEGQAIGAVLAAAAVLGYRVRRGRGRSLVDLPVDRPKASSPTKKIRRPPTGGGALALLLAAAWIAALSAAWGGCAAVPEEVRRLEHESTLSIEAYDANASRAVAGLLDAYEDASTRELDAVTALALREEEQTLEVVVGEDPPAEEGGAPVPRLEARRVLDPATVEEALRLYRDKTKAIRAERDAFAGAWRGARADFLDAVELRQVLREYLQRGGVEPEDVEALSDALAREIARRGGEGGR